MNPPNSGQLILRAITVALLGYIAFTLHQIENKTRPAPTRSDFFAAKTDAERESLFGLVPRMDISSSIEVTGEVHVAGIVDIGNEVRLVGPVDVRVVR